MTTFSATDAAFEGFRFTREHPWSVAVWAGVILVFDLVSALLGALVGGSALVDFQVLAQAQPIDLDALMALAPRLLPALAVSLVFNLTCIAIILPSALRSFLGIDRKVALRLGADEWRTGLVLLAMGLVNLAVSFGLAVLVGIVASIVSAVSQPLGGLVSFLGASAVFAVPVAIMVRLSLSPVIAVDRKRIKLKESWDSTRGHFWALTGSLVFSLVLYAVTFFLTAVFMGLVARLLTVGSGGRFDITAGSPGTSLGEMLTPAVLFSQVMLSVLVAMALPVLAGPLVRAYRAYDNLPA